MANEEMINRYFQIILDFDNQINSLQESIESETDYGIADGDPNIELEKELISKKIPESAAFKEIINHLAAVIDYIDNTPLDSRTIMLFDIELLKARRQLFVLMRERRMRLIDAYASGFLLLEQFCQLSFSFDFTVFIHYDKISTISLELLIKSFDAPFVA